MKHKYYPLLPPTGKSTLCATIYITSFYNGKNAKEPEFLRGEEVCGEETLLRISIEDVALEELRPRLPMGD